MYVFFQVFIAVHTYAAHTGLANMPGQRQGAYNVCQYLKYYVYTYKVPQIMSSKATPLASDDTSFLLRNNTSFTSPCKTYRVCHFHFDANARREHLVGDVTNLPNTKSSAWQT